VKTGDEQAKDDKQSIKGFISFIRGFLLGFGGIALLVGAFVIFNTMSITVAQRTRELATLRTLGATRRQVLRSVVLESVALGAIASIVGLGVGFGLARGLSALFSTLGFDLPEASSVYAWRTVIVSLLVGTLVTLLAGIAPALRATRVAPIAAVKEGTAAQPRRRRGLIAGATLLVLAVLLLGYAISGDRLGSPASLLALLVGAFALLSGTAAVASRLVTALATVLGLPARRFGAQRKRSPHRTPSGTPRARQRPRRR
jgi:putative ABC transport system permease protein